MDNSSLEISLKDATSNYFDNSNLPQYSNQFDYSHDFDYVYVSLIGGVTFGTFAFIQFLESCLVISVGLPLTLGTIYALYSQVRNGEVAPIYVINLLISDLFQFCCMIVEVAQPKRVDGFYVYWEIFKAFTFINLYSLMVSVGFMVCIALERYLFIVHPLWYRCRRTIKSSVLVCVLVWILPVVIVLLQRFSADFKVSYVIFTIFLLLPLPLLVFFLVATIRALSASISVTTEEKRRIAGMLVLVLLIYLLLFLPTIIMFVVMYSFYNNRTADNIIKLDFLSNLAPMFLKPSPLADLFLYIFLRKGTIGQLWACVCRCRKESNEISSVTVNVNMSAVRDGEREGQRTEEG